MSPDASRPWWRLSSRLVFIGFLAIGAFFLITEHRAHVVGWLPFLLLLICPIMHFMHEGHGGHGNHRDEGSTPDQRQKGRYQH